MSVLDDTHDAGLESWLESANDPATDFPIQNLPFGRFRRAADMDWRIGVAIGDQVLDLRRARVIDTYDMNRLMRLADDPSRALRQALSAGLRHGSAYEAQFRAGLVPQSEVEMGLPCHIGDYTDFYTSIHHATTVGRQFRPDNPLLPNYKWVPIGYHGRATSRAGSTSRWARSCPRTSRARRDRYRTRGLAADRGDARGRPPGAQADAIELCRCVLDRGANGRAPHGERLQPGERRLVRLGHLVRPEARARRLAAGAEPGRQAGTAARRRRKPHLA
jgi:Fumarylacetoacetase N-terminal